MLQVSRNIVFSVLVVLFFLACIAITINARDQEDFNLQQMGVESLVDRHTFALGESQVPQLQPRGDVFQHNGYLYAIKQPGQFVAGAVVYQILSIVGIRYTTDFVLSAALVTLLTSGLAVSFIGILLFKMGYAVLADPAASFVVAVLAVCGTMLLPYAGVSHHDTLATALFFGTFYITQHRSLLVASRRQFFWAGILLSLTLFFSMLPAALVLALFACTSWQQTRSTRWMFWIGFGLGLVPLGLYNVVLFGSIVAFPNAASGASDTFPFLSLANTVEKLRFYLFSPASSLWMFSPFLAFGVLGWFSFRKQFRSVGHIAAGLVFVHLAYITSIFTFGHAQFGPRYMLPVIPVCMVGIIGFLRLLSTKKPVIQYLVWTVFAALGSLSIAIQGVGAIIGVMYNDITVYPVPAYVQQLYAWDRVQLPLLHLGTGLFVYTALLGVLLLWKRNRSYKKIPPFAGSF